MQSGSLVECVTNFNKVKRDWPMLEYPSKGDVLTVRGVCEHPNEELREMGIVLLYFEELPRTPGICDKRANGKPNFVELLPPIADEDELVEDESCVADIEIYSL